MRRRTFISFLGGAAAAWPLLAQAQQSGKIPTVGVLWYAGSAEEEDVYLSVLVKAFHDLGYDEGRNIHFDHRFPAENPNRFRTLARELVDAKPDVIIAVTLLGALELKKATPTIPIVFVLVPDPIGSGLAESLARPGGNTTGLSLMAVSNAKGEKMIRLMTTHQSQSLSLGFLHSLIVLMMLDSDRALLLIEYLSRARTISSYSGSVVTGAFGTMCTIL